MEENGTINIYYFSLSCGLTRQIWSGWLNSSQGWPHSVSGASFRLAEASLQEILCLPVGWPELIYMVAERLSAARQGKPQWARTLKTSAGITSTIFPLVKPRARGLGGGHLVRT